MGIVDGEIKVTESDKKETVTKLLQSLISDDDEILTILYGEDVDEDEIGKLEEFVEDNFEDLEIETHNGKQPIYSYIFFL